MGENGILVNAYMFWMETEEMVCKELLAHERNNAARVFQKYEVACRVFMLANEQSILPHDFLELLLDNYLKNFPSELVDAAYPAEQA